MMLVAPGTHMSILKYLFRTILFDGVPAFASSSWASPNVFLAFFSLSANVHLFAFPFLQQNHGVCVS